MAFNYDIEANYEERQHAQSNEPTKSKYILNLTRTFNLLLFCYVFCMSTFILVHLVRPWAVVSSKSDSKQVSINRILDLFVYVPDFENVHSQGNIIRNSQNI